MKNDKMAGLICRMNQKKRSETLDGAIVTVKPIPEGGIVGELDPRSYGFAKQMLMLKKLLFRERETSDPKQLIRPYRTMFGICKSKRGYIKGVQTKTVFFPGAAGGRVSAKQHSSGEHIHRPADG